MVKKGRREEISGVRMLDNCLTHQGGFDGMTPPTIVILSLIDKISFNILGCCQKNPSCKHPRNPKAFSGEKPRHFSNPYFKSGAGKKRRKGDSSYHTVGCGLVPGKGAN